MQILYNVLNSGLAIHYVPFSLFFSQLRNDCGMFTLKVIHANRIEGAPSNPFRTYYYFFVGPDSWHPTCKELILMFLREPDGWYSICKDI